MALYDHWRNMYLNRKIEIQPTHCSRIFADFAEQKEVFVLDTENAAGWAHEQVIGSPLAKGKGMKVKDVMDWLPKYFNIPAKLPHDFVWMEFPPPPGVYVEDESNGEVVDSNHKYERIALAMRVEYGDPDNLIDMNNRTDLQDGRFDRSLCLYGMARMKNKSIGAFPTGVCFELNQLDELTGDFGYLELHKRNSTRDGFTNYAMIYCLAILKLLQAKNIVTVANTPPKQKFMRHFRKRKSTLPLVETRIIVIKEMKRRAQNDRHLPRDSEPSSMPFHSVRGHWADYREKGLFGKYKGLFWIPAHTRGDLEHGEIKKHYTFEEKTS